MQKPKNPVIYSTIHLERVRIRASYPHDCNHPDTPQLPLSPDIG